MFNLDFTLLFKIAQLLLFRKFPKFFEYEKAFLTKFKTQSAHKIEHRGVTYDLSDEDFYILEIGVAKDLISRINTDQEILAFFIHKSLITEDHAFIILSDCIMRITSEPPEKKGECKFGLIHNLTKEDGQSLAEFKIKISIDNLSECIIEAKEKAPLEVLIIFEPYLSELESAAARVGSILDSYITERHICLSL